MIPETIGVSSHDPKSRVLRKKKKSNMSNGEGLIGPRAPEGSEPELTE